MLSTINKEKKRNTVFCITNLELFLRALHKICVSMNKSAASFSLCKAIREHTRNIRKYMKICGDLVVIYKQYCQLIVFVVIFEKQSNEVLRTFGLTCCRNK